MSGSRPDEALERLTRLAATLLEAPHAQIALAAGVPADDPAGGPPPAGSRISVPLRDANGERLGSLVVSAGGPREWTARDREVLEALAEAAAVAAGAAILARILQETLLPPTLPEIPGLEVAARYHPAGTGVEVVGDFYDVFQSGREAWNIVVGDVMGKGINAAKVTALAHYTLRAAAMRGDSPSAGLATLNRALLEQASAVEPRFLTALLLTFTPGPHSVRLAMCTAGHEPPLLRRADGTAEFVELRGTLLGALPEPELEDVDLVLHTGEQLVLYTDGVIDARRGRERFGDERLRALVAASPAGTAAELADEIEAAVLGFNDGPLPDDAAMVVLVGRS